MISITRLPEPLILQSRKAQWLSILIASGKLRPDSSKYAHPSIRSDLQSMSFHKCFYCETKLKGITREIDHHIEVSVNITLSYEWSNLYLSCDNCNGKINHLAIPITTVLDPCINSDIEIRDNLTYNQEVITVKNNSQLGLDTIKKYRLDSDLLDFRRLKQLKNFYKLLSEIRQIKLDSGRQVSNNDEYAAINLFKQKDHPYSLMFKIIIDNTII